MHTADDFRDLMMTGPAGYADPRLVIDYSGCLTQDARERLRRGTTQIAVGMTRSAGLEAIQQKIPSYEYRLSYHRPEPRWLLPTDIIAEAQRRYQSRNPRWRDPRLPAAVPMIGFNLPDAGPPMIGAADPEGCMWLSVSDLHAVWLGRLPVSQLTRTEQILIQNTATGEVRQALVTPAGDAAEVIEQETGYRPNFPEHRWDISDDLLWTPGRRFHA
ncbi:hypothetical protein PQI66_00250 [Corynebacterium sp. USCH3]|uniref:hypothetical protein n=1 Tax=Corynebacterium sp. USCH3 TaxID=3024840 RepID=UPI0030A99EAC